MDEKLALLQAELSAVFSRLDVPEERAGMTTHPRRIGDLPVQIENEREVYADRAERRHQELLSLIQQLDALVRQQHFAALNEKHPAPLRWLQ